MGLVNWLFGPNSLFHRAVETVKPLAVDLAMQKIRDKGDRLSGGIGDPTIKRYVRSYFLPTLYKKIEEELRKVVR